MGAAARSDPRMTSGYRQPDAQSRPERDGLRHAGAVTAPDLPAELDHPMFASVLSNDDFRDGLAEYAELSLDQLVNNRILDAVPVVSTIRALAGGVLSIRETMLVRKTAAMLSAALDSMTSKDRERWQKRLATESGLRDTGERLLMIVDSVTSVTKADMVGRAFRHYLDGACDQVSLRRTIEMIAGALTEDLVELVNLNGGDPATLADDVQARLTSIGFLVNRSNAIMTSNSRPPATSSVATLLRRAQT